MFSRSNPQRRAAFARWKVDGGTGFAFLRALNTTSQHASHESIAGRGQGLVLWVLWLTYGSFYFCRNNLGVALPGIKAELHYEMTQLGAVLMALKLAYGAGQFINGQLAERLKPQKLLALGLLASAALNVVFGFATSLYFMTFIWACNGYVQALGWPPTMRVAANWFPPLQRGRAIGIIGTGYQLCAALTFVLSGWAASHFGWRGVLWVPAILLVASAIHMWIFLEDRPGEARSATPQGNQAGGSLSQSTAPGPGSVGSNLIATLANPSLWLVAVTLCLLDACRYGFTDWGVTHLKEVHHDSVDSAAFKYAVVPLGGILGALFAGWVSDRFLNGRRAPVMFVLLLVLGALGFAYDQVLHWGLLASVLILFAIGFCIFGSQVLLVGTFPVDLARRGTAAAAVGLVNFMGYMGAAAGDVVSPHLVKHYGWPFAVRFWAACAVAGAVIIAFLWNAGARSRLVYSSEGK